MNTDNNPNQAANLKIMTLIFCSLYPALLTYITFYLEIGYPVSYGAAKVIMVLIPVLIWWKSGLNLRTSLKRAGLFKTNVIPGLLTGILFSGAIMALYFFVLKDILDPAPIIEKVNSLGIMEYFLFVAIFLSLGNSLMEEYYWRSFIYSELSEKISSKAVVCLVSGLLFGIHHIFPLIRYFPLHFALLFTGGTMIAAGAWVIMRIKGYSIIDCYISHIFADLAIFYVGWDLIQSGV